MGALGKLARFAVRALEDEAPAARRAVKRAPSPTDVLYRELAGRAPPPRVAPRDIPPPQLEAFPGYDAAHRAKRLAAFKGTPRAGARQVPDIVYHGTPKDVAAFKTALPANTIGDPGSRAIRHASFFAEDPAFSQGYIEDAYKGLARGANIMPVHLRATNPFDLTDTGLFNAFMSDTDQAMVNAARFEKRIAPYIDMDAYQLYSYPESMRWELFDNERGKAFVDALRREGYDSAYLREPYPEDLGDYRSGMADVWAVFDPGQIKSVFNRGSFDPNDPDVLKARGGLAVKRKKR